MGVEQSQHKGPPEVLEALDLPSVAKYLKSDECRSVFVMLGAGVSTSAGIPDFRSPKTGLYANLARLNLPYPEAVFEINYFRANPTAFYTLARELLPGRFRPTLTHSFVRLLDTHGRLKTCFTQNIDTLERRAGVPASRIVEAHGSFAGQHCIECRAPFDADAMRRSLASGTIAKCAECEGLVKPDIVFFGEPLPPLFHRSVPRLRTADLLIVIGTSLTVQPFASLASMVPDSCPRVLINLDHVGDFGSRRDDVVCLGACDDVVRDLCKELGWDEELEKAWKETEGSVVDFGNVETVSERAVAEEDKIPRNAKMEQELEEIIGRMAQMLGETEASEDDDEKTSDARVEVKSPFIATTGEEILVLEDKTEPPTDNKVGEAGTESRPSEPPKEKL